MPPPLSFKEMIYLRGHSEAREEIGYALLFNKIICWTPRPRNFTGLLVLELGRITDVGNRLAGWTLALIIFDLCQEDASSSHLIKGTPYRGCF
jgi:hypothetical protein